MGFPLPTTVSHLAAGYFSLTHLRKLTNWSKGRPEMAQRLLSYESPAKSPGEIMGNLSRECDTSCSKSIRAAVAGKWPLPRWVSHSVEKQPRWVPGETEVPRLRDSGKSETPQISERGQAQYWAHEEGRSPAAIPWPRGIVLWLARRGSQQKPTWDPGQFLTMPGLPQ